MIAFIDEHRATYRVEPICRVLPIVPSTYNAHAARRTHPQRLPPRASHRGSQYVSIRYTERLAEAGIEPSVGSVGNSYNDALAETVIGLFKAEVIHRRGPWRGFEAV